MIKLIALYRTPADAAAFDKHYHEIHTPLVRKYPGLRKLEITRVTGAPIGDAKYHLQCSAIISTQISAIVLNGQIVMAEMRIWWRRSESFYSFSRFRVNAGS
jgi:hypothetical protein